MNIIADSDMAEYIKNNLKLFSGFWITDQFASHQFATASRPCQNILPKN